MADGGAFWLVLGVVVAAALAASALAGYAAGVAAGWLRGLEAGFRRGYAGALEAMEDGLHARIREALADELAAARFAGRQEVLDAAARGFPGEEGRNGSH